MPLSRLGCPLSLKTPNMGNTGLLVWSSGSNSRPAKRHPPTRLLTAGKMRGSATFGQCRSCAETFGPALPTHIPATIRSRS